MPLIVHLPVLQEVSDIPHIDPGARDLPQSDMRRLAARTRFALVARLLQESAPQTGTHLADFAGLFPLIRIQRALSLPHPLLRVCRLRLLPDLRPVRLGGYSDLLLLRRF